MKLPQFLRPLTYQETVAIELNRARLTLLGVIAHREHFEALEAAQRKRVQRLEVEQGKVQLER